MDICKHTKIFNIYCIFLNINSQIWRDRHDENNVLKLQLYKLIA